MPGLDLSRVSNNWKKLQEQLNSEKPTKKLDNSIQGLKRKRTRENQKPGGFKKTKLLEKSFGKSTVDRSMGSGESKPTGNGSSRKGHSQLAKEYDIAPEDLSAAYGSAPPSAPVDRDVVNGGLHPSHRVGKYVGLDCEMVGTGPPPHADHLLARVSLVNFHGEQIYDSFVLPPFEGDVKDYRTQFSGIRPHHLKPGFARPFAEVQRDVAKLLEARILVGHALRNDLQVLLLSHPKRDMRDTSRHAKFRVDSKGKPPALRNLAKSELGITIQTGEHSSIEDARAAMMLFRKEKIGFDAENRKQFGQHRRLDRKDAAARPSHKFDDDAIEEARNQQDDPDKSDLDRLDGEDDPTENEDEPGTDGIPIISNATKKKKKRKNKKRTKRY